MSQVFLAGPWWRSVPNVISLSRLACAPILLLAAFAGHPVLFRWLLLICLLSDIADGWIARHFNLRSEFGAKLDSRADMAVQAAAFAGMWNLHRAFVSDYRLPLLFMVAMYLAESSLALCESVRSPDEPLDRDRESALRRCFSSGHPADRRALAS